MTFIEVLLVFFIGFGTHAAIAQTKSATVAVDPANIVSLNAPGKYNRLRTGTQLALPDAIKTVEQATQYLIAPTGYSLMLPNASMRETAAILNRGLSQQVRITGYATIENALLIIAGDDVRLVVDHENKLLSFELIN